MHNCKQSQLEAVILIGSEASGPLGHLKCIARQCVKLFGGHKESLSELPGPPPPLPPPPSLPMGVVLQRNTGYTSSDSHLAVTSA